MNIVIKSDFPFSVSSIRYAPNGELCIELSSGAEDTKKRFRYTASLGSGDAEEQPSASLLEYSRKYVADSKIKEKSKDPYRQMIRFLGQYGDSTLDKVTTEYLQGFIGHLQSAGLSPNTVRLYFQKITCILNNAYREGLFLSVDPMSDKYPSLSPYAYCAWNPVKLVDPDGREIDISELNRKNKKGEYVHDELRKAFMVFAQTETGKKELAKYAKKDQVIYGIRFAEDGEYHSNGIDIAFSDYSQRGNSGNTNALIKGNRLSVTIKTSNFAQVSDCLENIGHEVFIHARQAVSDYLDDKKMNHSYLPSNLMEEVKGSNYSHNKALTIAEHKYFAQYNKQSRMDFVKMMCESNFFSDKKSVLNIIEGGLSNNIKMNRNGL